MSKGPRIADFRLLLALGGLAASPACARLVGADFDVNAKSGPSAEQPDPSDDQAGAGAGGSGADLLGQRCSEPGQSRCNGHAQAERVICNGKRWVINDRCADGERCEETSVTCVSVEPKCLEQSAGHLYCEGDELRACGPDGVVSDSTSAEMCAGHCVEADPALCAPPSCGDGKPEGAEQCDDGNADESDGCTSVCENARCGDGFVWKAHESCDPKAPEPKIACTPSCSLRAVELSLGREHSCARFSDGRVKCWGSGEFGALGLGDQQNRGDQAGSMGALLPAVELGKGRTAVQLASGDRHTCALLDDGTVKCWGSNDFGQLGLGDTGDRGTRSGQMGDRLPVVALGQGRLVRAITAAGDHSCALLDDGKIKCWGKNEYGELGLGDTRKRGVSLAEMGDALPVVDLGTDYTAIAVAGGWTHNCAILVDHHIKCWGANFSGELGQGDWDNRGDDPAKLGDALKPVDLGKNSPVLSLSLTEDATCAMLEGGVVKCFGSLGLQIGDIGHYPTDMGDALMPMDFGGGHTVKQLAPGARHWCFVLDDGTLRCWGNNDAGQLGLGDHDFRGDDPQETLLHMPALDLGTKRRAVWASAGWARSCAQLDNTELKCWGLNDHGQLGLGDVMERGGQRNQMGDALPPLSL